MATKDWKTFNTSLGFIGFKNKFDEATSVIISQRSNDYLVWIHKSLFGRGDVEKSFKSKSQALKFAKSYMRKH